MKWTRHYFMIYYPLHKVEFNSKHIGEVISIWTVFWVIHLCTLTNFVSPKWKSWYLVSVYLWQKTLTLYTTFEPWNWTFIFNNHLIDNETLSNETRVNGLVRYIYSKYSYIELGCRKGHRVSQTRHILRYYSLLRNFQYHLIDSMSKIFRHRNPPLLSTAVVRRSLKAHIELRTYLSPSRSVPAVGWRPPARYRDTHTDSNLPLPASACPSRRMTLARAL